MEPIPGCKSLGRKYTSCKMKKTENHPYQEQQKNDSSDISLSPGGLRPGAWSRGTSGGTNSRSDSGSNTPTPEADQKTNRYDLLSDSSTTPAFGDIKRGSRQSNSLRKSSQGKPNTNRLNLDERGAALRAAKSLSQSGSRNQSPAKSGDSSRNSPSSGSQTPSGSQPVSPNPTSVDDEKMRKTTKSIVEEYFVDGDYNEAMLCIKELNAPQLHNVFVEEAIVIATEKKPQNRVQTGRLIFMFLRDDVVDLNAFISGFNSIVELAPDLAVDIPLIYKCLGVILAPIIMGRKLTLSNLKDSLAPLIKFNKASIVMAQALTIASQDIANQDDVAELWRESGLKWEQLLDKFSSVDEFVRDKKVEYTLSTPSKKSHARLIQEELLGLLKSKTEQKTVMKYIDKKTEGNITSEIIREITYSVCRSAITEESNSMCKCDKNLLNSRKNILLRYINGSKDLELHATFALQQLVTDLNHPRGVLNSLFEVLYDGDIISEETINSWKCSKEFPDGKGNALSDVKAFMNWLEKAEAEESLEVNQTKIISPNPTSVDDEKKRKTGKNELGRNVRSILNKLTPQKFKTLVDQMTSLKIDSVEKLELSIGLIFEKAISEPGFSVAYANMCRVLTDVFKAVPGAHGEKSQSNIFRKILLNKCQKEFEKEKSDEKLIEEQRSKTFESEQEKKAWLEELDYRELQNRRRTLGNIRFIGELFKLKMISEKIMHECILKLLRNTKQESMEEQLECLCKLLTTIGKDLDHHDAKPRMDQYFQQIQKIIEKKKTSSRIRFASRDVMDLRNGGWVPRRDEGNPKTIDQIHREAREKENEFEKQRQQDKLKRYEPHNNRGGGRNSSVVRAGSNIAADRWTSVPSKTNRYFTPTLVDAKYNEKMWKMRRLVVMEYLICEDYEIAMAYLKTVKILPSLLVEEFCVCSMELTEKHRLRAGTLLCKMMSENIIYLVDIKLGLKSVIASSMDLIIDIPFFHKYLGEIIAPMISHKVLSLPQLKDMLLPMIQLIQIDNVNRSGVDVNRAGVVMAETLNKAVQEGNVNIAKLWRDSGIKWDELLDVGTVVEEFVEDNKVDYTIEPTHEYILMKKEHDNDPLSSIREESYAMCRKLIIEDSSKRLICDKESLNKLHPTFVQQIDGNRHVELEILYSIQEFVANKNHPRGLLSSVFHALYGRSIISKETFLGWGASTEHSVGKDVALIEVNEFLTLLRE